MESDSAVRGDHRRVWYYRDGHAGSRTTTDDVDFDLIRRARLLHVTGISPALSQTFADAVIESMRVARSAGVPVSFDFNYRGTLWSRAEARSFYEQAVPLADTVFAGHDEAEILLGPSESARDLALGLVEFGAGESVIKLGERGAIARVGGIDYEKDAVTVQVVDTVGAGDAFVAGYLAEYLAGSDVPTRLATAVAVAAYVCQSAGDWEGLPRRRELERAWSDPVHR